jgi:hypothetical protein
MNNEDAFWTPHESGNVLREEPPAYGATKPVFDLEERTARFGEAVIRFLKIVPHGPLTNRLIDQLVGAATSVGPTTAKLTTRCPKRTSRTVSAPAGRNPANRSTFFA